MTVRGVISAVVNGVQEVLGSNPSAPTISLLNGPCLASAWIRDSVCRQSLRQRGQIPDLIGEADIPALELGRAQCDDHDILA